MVEEPAEGRVYRAERRVRLSDADPDGRFRLDACARYLHDVSNDDARDSGLRDDGSWVVRRTELAVHRAPRFLERVSLSTWCGGTGSRWAERRVSVRGVAGGHVESASLWVYVDLATMLPKRLGEDFLGLYGPAAGGRTVGSKLLLPPADADAERRPWALRRTDLDVLGHVNNAAYWAAVEEVAGELLSSPHRAVLEYAKALDPGMPVELAVTQRDGSLSLWFQVDGTTHAAGLVEPLG